MSQGPETTFTGSVHRHLPAGLYRLKNHNQFHGGIADVWYSGGKADLWVEYKFLAVPKRDETVIDLCRAKGDMLSPLQQLWLEQRHAEGRNVAVIVGSKDGGVILPGLSWQPAMTAADFRKNLLLRKDVAGWIVRQVNG